MDKDKEELKRKVNYLLDADYISEKAIIECVKDYKYNCKLPNIDEMYEMKVKELIGVSDFNLKDRSRKREIIIARSLMFIYYKSFGISHRLIAKKFNIFKSTVSISVKTFKHRYNDNDPLLMNYLNRDRTILTDKMVEFIKR